MQLYPYLNFSGECEAAFKFYAQVLGGKIESLFTFAGSPMESQVPPEWGKKVMHAHFVAGNAVLAGSDAPPGRYEKPQGFQVTLNLKDPAEAERIFNALADKGTVVMPCQQTFWAVRFGMCVDRFGIPWMINCSATT